MNISCTNHDKNCIEFLLHTIFKVITECTVTENPGVMNRSMPFEILSQNFK